MNTKLRSLLFLFALLTLLQACNDCGPFVQVVYRIDSLIGTAYDESGATPVEIGAATVSILDVMVVAEQEAISIVAYEKLQQENFLQGFGSVVLACDQALPMTKHPITGIEVYSSTDIEFDMVYASGTDLSEQVQVGFFDLVQDVADALVNPRHLSEGDEVRFYFKNPLGAPYSGNFTFRLVFKNGQEVDATTQLLSLE